jgi:ribosomal protein L11 methyltransferase
MDLWEIRVEIPADATEATDLALQESGVEGWSLLEDAIARRAWIVGIFEDPSVAAVRWAGLRPSLPAAPASEPEPRRLPDSDWKNSYREHFKAWTFGRLHWVPVWERPTFVLPAGHSVLWLDPGLAFGTGNHETTRLCIERLVEFEAAKGSGAGVRVVDAGCGSGILALSAAKLGFTDIAGFDNDPEAVRVSLENAAANGIPASVRFSTAALPEGIPPACADVLLANIQADVLIRHARELAAAVSPGGLLVMSGILGAEIGSVREAFARVLPGCALDSRELGEWCDACLRPPAA